MTFVRPALRGNETGAWLWDGTLNEYSGSGAPNMTLIAGTTRWVDMLPGVKGFSFDQSTKLAPAAHYAGFENLGAATLEGLFRPSRNITTSDAWALFGHAGQTIDTTVHNFNYHIYMWDEANAKQNLVAWYHEHGSGTDDIINPARWTMSPGGLYYICGIRTAPSGGSCTSSVYARRAGSNSSLVISASKPAPTGGTDSTTRFTIGANGSNDAASRVFGSIAFVRYTAAEISSADRLAAENAFFADFPVQTPPG